MPMRIMFQIAKYEKSWQSISAFKVSKVSTDLYTTSLYLPFMRVTTEYTKTIKKIINVLASDIFLYKEKLRKLLQLV